MLLIILIHILQWHSLNNKILSCCLLFAPFGALKRTVVVEFYLHVRFNKVACVRQSELHVLYVQSTLQPLLFVVSMYSEYFPCFRIDICRLRAIGPGAIQVIGAEEQGQVVFADETGGIGEEEIGIGLQVYHSTVFHKVAITV